MTTNEIAEALSISKGRVYQSLRDRRTYGIKVAGKIKLVSIVGGDKRNGYLYDLADATTSEDPESTSDFDPPSIGLAAVNKWQKAALKKLRAQKGNPFALMTLAVSK